MPTPKRVWNPGFSYHVTTRGNRKSDIFLDKNDYNMYLKLLKDCFDFYVEDQYELICYCLMSNHVHLLIKTCNKPLEFFMRRLNSMYTKYFNKKYDYSGHLFQGKYHCELIMDNIQMLEASRYIHLNPFRAKMVQSPEEYGYSSYSTYIGLHSEENLILSHNIILDHFYGDKNKGALYKRFVELAPRK
jgi:putative transposase